MKEYYTTAETARELDTTIRTVSRWLKTGVITGKKPGDTWQITAAEVERMRNERPQKKPGRKFSRKLSMS